MKKTLVVALFSSLSFSLLAQQPGFTSGVPAGSGSNGFHNPSQGVTTAARASDMWDESWVVLEGSLIRQVEHELYEFRDSSGTIYVDIDDSDWMGQSASPGSRVRLEGEVDTDFGRDEVDVKRVTVIR